MNSGKLPFLHWHSTKDPAGPKHGAEPGTFRDIDLAQFDVAWVDRIDAECQKRSIPRSLFLQLAVQTLIEDVDRVFDAQPSDTGFKITLDK